MILNAFYAWLTSVFRFGRTRKFFPFEHYDIVPDILVTGKGISGGLPIGTFTVSFENMKHLNRL